MFSTLRVRFPPGHTFCDSGDDAAGLDALLATAPLGATGAEEWRGPGLGNRLGNPLRGEGYVGTQPLRLTS